MRENVDATQGAPGAAQTNGHYPPRAYGQYGAPPVARYAPRPREAHPPPAPRQEERQEERQAAGFNADAIRAASLQEGLLFPEHAIEQIVAGVDSGKHLILTGPPGTGKTTLAYIASEVARHAMMCTGYMPTTATSEWTTFETIGGIQPTPDGLIYRPGMFIESIEQGKWLVIDELNRANFDRAFGQLFTVLSGQPVVLPFKRKGESKPISVVPSSEEAPPDTNPIFVPKNWRIIGTMNIFDKNLLFDLSYALMRRFAFIEIPCPPKEIYENLLSRENVGGVVASDLMVMLDYLDLGPAIFLDAAKYATRRAHDGISHSRLVYETFYAYFLSQFEGMKEDDALRVYERVASMLEDKEQVELIRNFKDVLGYDVNGSGEALSPASTGE